MAPAIRLVDQPAHRGGGSGADDRAIDLPATHRPPDVAFLQLARDPHAPARKFHTLLAGGATECSENCYVVEGRRDFRAYYKTARRFCLSPHDLEAGARTPPRRPADRRGNRSECANIDSPCCRSTSRAWTGETWLAICSRSAPACVSRRVRGVVRGGRWVAIESGPGPRLRPPRRWQARRSPRPAPSGRGCSQTRSPC